MRNLSKLALVMATASALAACGDPLVPGDGTQSIKVTSGGKSMMISLAGLGSVTTGNNSVSAPIDVIWAKVTGEDVRQFTIDIVCADGTRPSEVPACAQIVPFDGAHASRGLIDLKTRDLGYSPDDQTAHCVLRNVSELIFTRMAICKQLSCGPVCAATQICDTTLLKCVDPKNCAPACKTDGTEFCDSIAGTCKAMPVAKCTAARITECGETADQYCDETDGACKAVPVCTPGCDATMGFYCTT